MNPSADFFRRHGAIRVSDRNGAARYEDSTPESLADWLRDRDDRVRAGNQALAREREELLAAARQRLDTLMARRRDDDAEAIGLLVAVLARVESPAPRANHWTEEGARAAGDVDPVLCIHGRPRNVFCGRCES